jgi:hypothetical protein
MDDERGPIDKLLIDFFQSFIVGLVEPNFFPELIWEMCSFCCFHVEIADSLFFSNRGVLRVGQWTRFAIA